MGRIEKTVFISYRRTNYWTALAVYQNLTAQGYDVFIDYQNIRSGDFEKAIFDNIKARAHFLVILSPSALERCDEPTDLMRREIETALDEERNIIPLMMEGFDFGNPAIIQILTGKLAQLKRKNGLRIIPDFFLEAMDRLRKEYLNIALEDVLLHSLNVESQEASETQKAAANDAAAVEASQLTAEEWFERGYVFVEDKNFDEAVRCYKETIRLEPNFFEAHNNLGSALNNLKRYEEAEVAYRKAIELDPSLPAAYSNLGITLNYLKRYEEAEAAFRKAIELNPSEATPYSNLGNLLSNKNLKHYDEAEAAYRKAIELDPSLPEIYGNLGITLNYLKRYEEAEAAFRKAIELNPSEATPYSNLGNLLRNKNLKHYDEAEAAYRKAIELNSSDATTHYNLGNLLIDLIRYDEAENAYRKAIELNPSYVQYLRQLWVSGRLKSGVNSAQTGDLLKNVSQ